jgi:hypothetical protein
VARRQIPRWLLQLPLCPRSMRRCLAELGAGRHGCVHSADALRCDLKPDNALLTAAVQRVPVPVPVPVVADLETCRGAFSVGASGGAADGAQTSTRGTASR